MQDASSAPGPDDARFIRRTLIVLGLAGLIWVIVKVANVLLLAFCAVLVAIILRSIADLLRKRLPLGPTAGLAAAIGLVAIGAGLSLWLFGSEVERQLASLSVTVPAAWLKFQTDLSGSPLGARLLAEVRALDGKTGLLDWAPRLVGDLASGAVSAVLVLFAGIFLALRPDEYRRGLVRLLPRGFRPRFDEVLAACGTALRQWLLSQVGSMLMVGLCVGTALSLAGVRSPVALGLLAGLGQFVPLVGPFVVAAPGVLLALADGPAKLAWAVVIYVGVGQIESNLFTPMLLRRTAKLPMAVTLFAVLAFGILLGPLGVLLATPLAVVIYVLVKMVYVEGLLERGEATEPSAQLRSLKAD